MILMNIGRKIASYSDILACMIKKFAALASLSLTDLNIDKLTFETNIEVVYFWKYTMIHATSNIFLSDSK